MKKSYRVNVAVALSRPPSIDEWRHYHIVADTGSDAALAACQMAACTSVMPVAVEVEE